MNLNPSTTFQPHGQAFHPAYAVRPPLGVRDVVLKHLRTEAEISGVLHLREEIDLSVHATAGSQFHTLEKKETSWGLFLRSSWAGNGLARSGSCR
jgi:hypothetical protein